MTPRTTLGRSRFSMNAFLLLPLLLVASRLLVPASGAAPYGGSNLEEAAHHPGPALKQAATTKEQQQQHQQYALLRTASTTNNDNDIDNDNDEHNHHGEQHGRVYEDGNVLAAAAGAPTRATGAREYSGATARRRGGCRARSRRLTAQYVRCAYDLEHENARAGKKKNPPAAATKRKCGRAAAPQQQRVGGGGKNKRGETRAGRIGSPAQKGGGGEADDEYDDDDDEEERRRRLQTAGGASATATTARKERAGAKKRCPAATANIDAMDGIFRLCQSGNLGVRQCVAFGEAYVGYTMSASSARRKGSGNGAATSTGTGTGGTTNGNGNNNMCPMEARNCPDGSLAFRTHAPQCDFAPCPCCDALSEPGKFGNDVLVPEEKKYVCCPDGSWGILESSAKEEKGAVYRCASGETISSFDLRRAWRQQTQTQTPQNNGKTGGENCNVNRRRDDGRTQCPRDTTPCPDGSKVARNWNTVGCMFEQCDGGPAGSGSDSGSSSSSCCNMEDYVQCDDGSQARCCPGSGAWTCPEIDAVTRREYYWYPCEGGLISGDLGPFGVACASRQ